ncbi:MAG: hypothetical protein JXJ04_17395 [Spirochaetales bacterium]|nr:hypothetical protein [Spirochaetales bacterium]
MFLNMYDSGLICRQTGVFKDAMFVDLGFGKFPATTLQTAEYLRRINPELLVLGVEIDKTLVLEAEKYSDDLTQFRYGGFNLPLKHLKNIPIENVRIIRAFNVLRQYNEDEVYDAFMTLGHYLLPGGLIIEGTSDPYGRVWAANILRKNKSDHLIKEALVFSTNFKGGFEPRHFQPILPKNYIHHMVPGEEIYTFIEDWKKEYKKNLSTGKTTAKQLFIDTARNLKEQGYAVETRKKWLARGFLIWMRDEVLSM